MEGSESGLSFDIVGIQKCQRNRYPMLFVDEISQVIPLKSASGKKCFSFNEWFFPAHYEDDPNVPGFIQVECLVQTFIMTFLCVDEYQGKKTSFVKMNNVSYRRKIIPGNVLEIKATLDRFKRGIATGSAVSFVNGEPACSAEFVVAIPDVLNSFKPKA
jgi:3-hydroxyacyl-[acyl-carrier-protein] dehydratase